MTSVSLGLRERNCTFQWHSSKDAVPRMEHGEQVGRCAGEETQSHRKKREKGSCLGKCLVLLFGEICLSGDPLDRLECFQCRLRILRRNSTTTALTSPITGHLQAQPPGKQGSSSKRIHTHVGAGRRGRHRCTPPSHIHASYKGPFRQGVGKAARTEM